jgi:glycine dehydrogenase subunit 2
VLNAPHTTRLSRLDETAAARRPVLRWTAARAAERLEAATPAKEW